MFKRLLLTATLAVALSATFAVTASAAPMQTLVAPTSCAQALVPLSGWGGGTSEQRALNVQFSATCVGRIKVEWQATDATGHAVWTSTNHHFNVSATAENIASVTWAIGKTPPGTYDVFLTLASQNSHIVYYYGLQTQEVVP